MFTSALDIVKLKRASLRHTITSAITPDSSRTLFFVHVGKTGGTTVDAALRESPIVQDLFSRVTKVHTFSPPSHSKSRYLFVLRNPIDRAFSAFNWRYELLIVRKTEESYWAGEKKVLERYQSLENLARSLVSGGEIDARVAKDYRSIHHLREGYGLYLQGLSGQLHSSQIFGLFATSELNTRLPALLGIPEVRSKRVTPKTDDAQRSKLSELARRNLRLFLAKEFELLETLLSLTSVPESTRDSVLGS